MVSGRLVKAGTAPRCWRIITRLKYPIGRSHLARRSRHSRAIGRLLAAGSFPGLLFVQAGRRDRAQSIAGDLITSTMCARPTAAHYRRNGRPLLNGPRSGLPSGLPLPFSTVSRLSAAASPRTCCTRSRRSSSIRARMAEKSSAARGRAMFPPIVVSGGTIASRRSG
jgi:hypothetical protein